jgi:hypothetical protein
MSDNKSSPPNYRQRDVQQPGICQNNWHNIAWRLDVPVTCPECGSTARGNPRIGSAVAENLAALLDTPLPTRAVEPIRRAINLIYSFHEAEAQQEARDNASGEQHNVVTDYLIQSLDRHRGRLMRIEAPGSLSADTADLVRTLKSAADALRGSHDAKSAGQCKCGHRRDSHGAEICWGLIDGTPRCDCERYSPAFEPQATEEK